MAVSNIKVAFPCDIKKVWETVTSLENYAWRGDLSKIEIVSGKQFVEFTKEGYATTFTITVMEPYQRYEFDMENDNIKGHWVGVFSQKGEQTEIDFTEDVTAKKLFMKPFVKAYLKKQQTQYISDLKKALL
ncbi:MAG: SRPBCC family protein [Oscillospiraceae bacterium]|nr:SRPBCC family protein [Oscillospiraceae bacterium]